MVYLLSKHNQLSIEQKCVSLLPLFSSISLPRSKLSSSFRIFLIIYYVSICLPLYQFILILASRIFFAILILFILCRLPRLLNSLYSMYSNTDRTLKSYCAFLNLSLVHSVVIPLHASLILDFCSL